MTSLWKKEGNRHVRCDTGCDFSWLWFVMPFVDGGSFRLFSLRLIVLQLIGEHLQVVDCWEIAGAVRNGVV